MAISDRMKNERELEILKTAQKLIIHHGYHKVTMKDIADACRISRPTLYKSFQNKEAVISELIDLQIEDGKAGTENLAESRESLENKLKKFFDLWTISPAALAIDSTTGRDLLLNVANYAPQAVDKLYLEFEQHLTSILEPQIKKDSNLKAEDLAHILALATRGLKSSSGSLPELRRMIDGLIIMTIATINNKQ